MKNLFEVPVTDIKGIGEKRREQLNDAGIYSVFDLLNFYPVKYDDRRAFSTIDKLCENQTICVTGWLKGGIRTYRKRRNFSISSGNIADETGVLPCIWYNMPYIDNAYKPNNLYVFYGKIQKSARGLQMVNPVVEAVDDGNVMGKIVPIYPKCKGFSEKTLQKMLLDAIDTYKDDVSDTIPKSVSENFKLMSYREMLKNIHFPDDYKTLLKARERVVFEEFFMFQMSLAKLKHAGKKKAEKLVTDYTDFEQKLPFRLTDAQLKVVNEIKGDLSSGFAMNRLLQGDVGSGKTVVAAYGIDIAVKNGFQTALMAPTEILATQHYNSFKKFFPENEIALLTSSTPKKSKAEIKQKISEGTIKIVIGTHALIEDGVEFLKLGLVITDEQHRFGVAQRTKLSEKALSPHVLVMTATPIPRTLGLIMYGDLDISVIDELPPGRQEIKTYLVNEGYRNRVYGFLKKQIESGGQAYIICPLVEESESINAKDATGFAKELTSDFPDIKIGLLHGKMKEKEKAEVMDAFAHNKISVLVSTTVIEVGVDVPNATLMVIENAERFGLSQLHQLRGRVGRGTKQSYCILFGNTHNPETIQRLKVIESSADGFFISEKDLELRGPGDFFGTRQHGLPALKTANPMEDTALLYKAKEAVDSLLKGTLKATADEKKLLNYFIKIRYFSGGKAEILN